GVESVMGDPHVTPQQLAELVSGIAGPSLEQHGRNFVQTLAENRRLAYLPEIAVLFDELKSAEEGIVDVTVTSAAPLDEKQKLSLAEALSKKLKRQVRLTCETDGKLIAGAVLPDRDLVIEGSFRTALERIAYGLTA